MVKAIIFDLQGTLVENGIYPSPLRQIKSILRINAPFSDFVMRFEKILMVEDHASLKDAFKVVCEDFQIQPKDFLLEKMVGLWNKNKLLSKVYADTIESLEELKKDYKLILVANIDSFSKDVVERFELSKYFDKILFSCDVHMLKGDKGFYTSVFEEYDLELKDVVLVGDSLESDMTTAKILGIEGILIDRHNKREYADKILSLTELKNILSE